MVYCLFLFCIIETLGAFVYFNYFLSSYFVTVVLISWYENFSWLLLGCLIYRQKKERKNCVHLMSLLWAGSWIIGSWLSHLILRLVATRWKNVNVAEFDEIWHRSCHIGSDICFFSHRFPNTWKCWSGCRVVLHKHQYFWKVLLPKLIVGYCTAKVKIID